MAQQKIKQAEILIVDDTTVNIEFARKNLKENGFSVDFATSGEMAVERAKITLPDLILIDINMPGLDGYETSEKLRQNPKTKNIPIIFMTSHLDNTDTDRFINSGAIGFIRKPLEINDMLLSISKVLPIPGQPNEDDEKDLMLVPGKEQNGKHPAQKNEFKISYQYLSQISHEIRTPLSALLNFVGLIKDEFENTENSEFNDIFESIKSVSNRLTRAVEMFIDLTEVKSENYNFHIETIDIKDLIEAVYNELSQLADSKGLEIITEINTDKTKIEGDTYSTWQIIRNLVDNAIKCSIKGNVFIKAYTNSNNKLVLEVTDSGIGIEKEYIKTLFDPFSMEQGNYPYKFEGNGLGLALTRQYSILNKADIEVETSMGEGTTFKVIFSKS
ncbi:MAG: hybrid sensor histidine kinase/response regulator [Ignavibacteria bacterium]|nr:hybrid sensor histidine kinase/response regulator [Ignavibacteria bacterium]